MKVTIGTRGSDLALWQANHVSALLIQLGLEPKIQIISTKGDQIQHLGFDKMEGKGFFTKEIEEALLNKTIDLAVHSHKDLETTQPEGLTIAAVPERGFVEDTLLIRKECVNPSGKFLLNANATVGTSSVRRKAQLTHYLPELNIIDLRGNVPTRIQKLRNKQYDAIVLAKAGMMRLQLDLSEFHIIDLTPSEFVPAPAQGALALQTRVNDPLVALLNPLNHPDNICIEIERNVLRSLGGGCQVPFGAYCAHKDGVFILHTMYKSSNSPSAQYHLLRSENAKEVTEMAISKLK
ncbi:MAG: hydroxymethylbilane synthase [Flavobacteriales bacterium]|jgi:hydroxymethylbilane synthase